jgi:predicted phage-related endonuclease
MTQRELKNDSAKNRGKKLEPVARQEFEDLTGLVMPAVCGHHVQAEYLKVSLDGWNAERSSFLEIKAPNQKAHGQALSGHVPGYYVPQILHQVLVTGAQDAWYVSFSDKWPPGQRVGIVHVTADNCKDTLGVNLALADMVDALRDAEDAFWGMVVKGSYTPLPGEEF